ncbi:DUF2314 domain-containing protein [bacterium]|nr:DUF2314 domain-containing protein [bacterium]
MSDEIFLHDSGAAPMVAAVKNAQDSFRIFSRELVWESNRIIPGLELAAVKVPFSDPPEIFEHDGEHPNVENMWIMEVSFDGADVSGTLVNNPGWLKSVKEGDSIAVKPSEINDWMYSSGGRVYGGFTVNVIRSAMGKAERKQHDDAWGGLDFGDPQNVLLVPQEYLGRDEPKPGLLSRLFSKPVPSLPQTLSEVTMSEHPMAVNCLESMCEQADEDPDVLNFTYENGMTQVHRFAMAGAADIVDAFASRGADLDATTDKGLTAFQIAQSLGWKNVSQILKTHGASTR